MRKSIFVIVFVLLATAAFGLNWGDDYWMVQPSLLPFKDGDSIKTYFTSTKWPTLKFEVYLDEYFLNMNGDWVYAQWMQDHGWYYDGNGRWRGNRSSSQDPILGALYIDPYEKVAIYFFPSSEGLRDAQCAFRVRVLNK
jgi:hypothetical protein